jgi:hypothetical protein
VGREDWYLTLVREIRQDAFVHRVDRLRTVHAREGGDIGQVDFGQIRIIRDCQNNRSII